MEAIEELLRIKFLVPRYTSSSKLLDYFNTHHYAKLKTTQIKPITGDKREQVTYLIVCIRLPGATSILLHPLLQHPSLRKDLITPKHVGNHSSRTKSAILLIIPNTHYYIKPYKRVNIWACPFKTNNQESKSYMH